MSEASTLDLEPVPAAQRRHTIAPEHVYRGGGKPGRKCRAAPQVLRDMRLVYANPAAAATPGQKALSRLFEADAAAFLRELAAMERAHSTGAVLIAPPDDARQSPNQPDPAAA